MGMQRKPSYAKCGVDRVITLRYLVEHEVSRKLQYLPIQPQALLIELHFHGNNRFLDIFLFFGLKPKVNDLSSQIRENHNLLPRIQIQKFDDIFIQMYEDHKDGKTYHLDENAKKQYNALNGRLL